MRLPLNLQRSHSLASLKYPFQMRAIPKIIKLVDTISLHSGLFHKRSGATVDIRVLLKRRFGLLGWQPQLQIVHVAEPGDAQIRHMSRCEHGHHGCSTSFFQG